MDEVMRQNPDLMNQFTKAAVNSMENTSPGLGGFMNEFRKEPKQREPMTRSMPMSNTNTRNEMKGPENINTILSSLKKINVDNESTISAEEIDIMSNQGTSRRKRRSDKNTISLAI